jgi:BirA family biotin operon repressor/biotin-[acetyl-CoA-carboxylase] ligase
MTSYHLLAELADGEFHSGEELAALLGVSRTAVWKQLKKLDRFELELYSVRGKGYKLATPLELLDKQGIVEGLSAGSRRLLGDLDIHLSIDSTNSHTLEKAKHNFPSGYVCIAEQQTDGKGRRDRRWVSPFGTNLYLSVLWQFSGGVNAMEGLSLAVGVALARALEELGLQGVQLKWPNDLYHDGKKLGGVLIEMTGDLAGQCQAVVGVGLNVKMPTKSARQIEQDWTDIATACPSPPSRNRIAAALLDELLKLLASYEQKTFTAYHRTWEKLDAYRGKPVQLVMGSRCVRGLAAGVDGRGAIGLRNDAGVHYYNGGEISLRPDHDS